MAKKAKKKGTSSNSKRAAALAGPVNHLIEVVADTEHFQLRVVEGRVAAKPGDTLIWVFRGIPEGWLPWIEFPDQLPYGPFPSLTVSSVAIWGTLPGGDASSREEDAHFPYRAVIRTGLGRHQKSYGALLRSPMADLDVQPVAPAQIEVVVTYDAESSELGLSPTLIKRNPGDTVKWSFQIPEDVLEPGSWLPRIDFFRFDGSTGAQPANLSLGPFTSLAHGLTTVVGMGNTPSPGIYSYTAVVIHQETGSVQLKSTPDPVIDDRGEPLDLSGDPG